LSEIKSPHLGLCYDSSHSRLKKHNYLLEEFKDRLFATHISDNDGFYDRHWLPGNGIINWFEISKIFPKDYRGYLTLETRPTDEEAIQGPENFVNKAFERIKHIKRLF
jgi:sugar phosphate isomerase/epimerase